MPPRWLCLLIVMFWLACNGWLFWHDLLPQVVPGQPPPYTIDLVEEAQVRRPVTSWTVYRDDRKVLDVSTSIEHPERDVFELTARYEPAASAAAMPVNGGRLQRMTSVYRVNAAGNLLGIDVRIEGVSEGPLALLHDRFTSTVTGEVKRGRLHTVRRFELKGGQESRIELPEAAAPRGAAVLLPLHPVKRLRGLSPGQSWQMTVLDPLAGLAAVREMTGEARVARCRVRPDVEPFSRGSLREVPCLVIDCTGEDMDGSIWIRQDNGLVVCQKITLDKTHWELYQERTISPRKASGK
jgi:hypothetical protein